MLAHVGSAIDDPEVAVDEILGIEPSPVSATDADAFRALHRSIAEVMPDAVVVPTLLVAATDSRHYAGVAEQVYRFAPTRLTRRDIERIHGADDRIAVENLGEIIRFYVRLIENAAG